MPVPLLASRRIVLKNVRITTVKPCRKSEHPSVIEMSVIDNTLTDAYISVILCYRPMKGGGKSSELAAKMKKSLSEVLVPYFPFAGRLVRISKGNSSRNLHCNDEGVPFIEADVDADMNSVVNVNSFQSEPLLTGFHLLGLDSTDWFQDVAFPLPSLFVQMTRFKCGGVVVNVAFNHHADGDGMFNFLQAWSQIAMKVKTSSVPIHDRALLQFPTEDVEVPEEASEQSIFQQPNPLTFKTMHVKREVIQQLKRQAAENSIEVTTVDLITSHMWRCMATNIEAIDKTRFPLMCTAVNGRKNLQEPVVPEQYSGNAFITASFTHSPGGELSTKSHLFAANLVHRVVANARSKTWQSALKEFPTQISTMPPGCEWSEINSGPMNRRLVTLSSWFRFPLYETDFGSGFGKPYFACFNATYSSLPLASTTIINPPPPSRSDDTIATLVIGVEKGIAPVVFSDQLFLSFFH